jgi:hypothetical protein
VLTAGRVDRGLRDLAAEQEAQPERLEAQRRDVRAELSRVEGRLAKLAGPPEVGRQVLRKLLVDAIVVVPEADGTWTYSATLTLHRAVGGILGGEAWAVRVGQAVDDLDGEVKAVLRGQIEASRLSDTPSSRNWR